MKKMLTLACCICTFAFAGAQSPDISTESVHVTKTLQPGGPMGGFYTYIIKMDFVLKNVGTMPTQATDTIYMYRKIGPFSSYSKSSSGFVKVLQPNDTIGRTISLFISTPDNNLLNEQMCLKAILQSSGNILDSGENNVRCESAPTTGTGEVLTGTLPAVYPNPAQKSLTLEDADTYTVIEVMDMDGRIVPVTISHNEIDVAMLRSGMYLLRATQHEKVRMTRFIKE